MIYLHTGQPGAGKTLFTLSMVRERAEKESRPVYYAGIEILKPEMFPGWVKLDDPAKWMECPDGAIIIHDECQTLYRPRGNGAAVPPYVARYETHRHNGWDIYLITQHPMLVDSNIRRLAGEHVHVVRAFGSKMATLHRWGQVKEQCDKSRADSVSETRAYPAQLFGAYQSATVHTHKARIPPRVYFLLLVPILLAAAVWVFWQWQQKQSGGAAFENMPGKVDQMTGQVPGQGAGSARPPAKAITTAEYLEVRKPRIDGLPHTAPVYDGVTQVAHAPVPSVCIASAERCVCYTQQATRMNTPDGLCRQIADKGYFVEWDTSPARDSRDRRELAAASPTAARDVERLAVADGGGLIRSGGTWSGVPPMGR